VTGGLEGGSPAPIASGGASDLFGRAPWLGRGIPAVLLSHAAFALYSPPCAGRIPARTGQTAKTVLPPRSLHSLAGWGSTGRPSAGRRPRGPVGGGAAWPRKKSSTRSRSWPPAARPRPRRPWAPRWAAPA